MSDWLEMALQEIVEKKGILYDPQIVEACLRLFREKGFRILEGKPEPPPWLTMTPTPVGPVK